MNHSMDPYSTCNSRDELLRRNSYPTDDIDTANNSMPSSGADTPQHEYPTAKKRVDWSIPEGQEEELRTELHRVLTDANGPSLQVGTTSPSLIARPKSVLRKGDVTPNNNDLGDINEGIADLEDKTHSAQDAHARASKVAEDLSRPSSPSTATEVESPSKKRKRHRSPTRKSLFHASEDLDSGCRTPAEPYEDYVPKPTRWRTGGLSAFGFGSKWRERLSHSRRNSLEEATSPGTTSPGAVSPPHSHRGSTTSLGDLVLSSTSLGAIGGDASVDAIRSRRPPFSRPGSVDRDATSSGTKSRPSVSRRSSSVFLDTIGKLGSSWRSTSDLSEIRIAKHLQDTQLRQKYLVKLCRALMQYGAPTHRLEEYMKMTARVLEIEAQFLYIPGCMLISFDDTRTHTAEVKLVRSEQGVDLGKLYDTHQVYREVVHDKLGVEEAAGRVDNIIIRDPKFPPWLRVLFYALASASVSPWAFEARPIDLPMCFLLGAVVGYLNVYWAQQSTLHRNVVELLAVIITSFFARLFGSLKGGNLFCFSALAQSGITMILPGYTMLCGALELQARSIIAGSVRLVWAIIYALFLGFGLTIGTAIYGVLDGNATSQTTCQGSMRFPWFFLFVPVFTLAVAMINFAKYKQMPIMVVISFSGYVVSYFAAARFQGNPQISSTFGAMVVSLIANLYSRFSLHLEAVGDRATGWFQKRWNAIGLSKNGLRNSQDPTPSALEKQATELSEKKSFRSIFRRFPILNAKRAQTIPAPSNTNQESLDSAKEKEQPRVYPLAASAMLPGIFALVPSGLSVAGSLVSGLETANQITRNHTGSTVTAYDVTRQRAVGDNISFTVSYSIVQIAIGMSVGLFFGTLLVYPVGKGGKRSSRMRSGLFTF